MSTEQTLPSPALPRKGEGRARTPGALHKPDRADAAAKRMRRAPTYAEQRLWKVLRTTDLHFRRQAPMGPYIVDFVCHKHRSAVEVDGGIHNLPEVAARDAERGSWLEGRGYSLMRFTNQHVVSDTLSVVQMILARVSADTPTPDPFPKREGEPMEFF